MDIEPGYDWHYVIIHAQWVAIAFPGCDSIVHDVHEPVLQLHDIQSHRNNRSQCYTVPVNAKHMELHDICGTILVYRPGYYIFHWTTNDSVWHEFRKDHGAYMFFMHEQTSNNDDVEVMVVYEHRGDCVTRKTFADNTTIRVDFMRVDMLHILVLVHGSGARLKCWRREKG